MNSIALLFFNEREKVLFLKFTSDTYPSFSVNEIFLITGEIRNMAVLG
jgi:hypothetical protein